MYLLDTCTLLWLASDHSALSPRAKAVVLSGDATLYFSAISALELERLRVTGRIVLASQAERWLSAVAERYQLQEIPVDAGVAAQAIRLAPIHKDPCDRILIATAQIHKLAIVTADTIIPTYPKVHVVW